MPMTKTCPAPLRKAVRDVENGAARRVFLVCDYRPLVKALTLALEEEGFAVDCAPEAEGDYPPAAVFDDAVILDLAGSRADGLALLQNWRRAGLTTPVLVLTVPDGSDDKLHGTDAGADWLIKPFELEELLIRLRAMVGYRLSATGYRPEEALVSGIWPADSR